jgi:DNA polymerase IV (DinB-like DNA polymerase)
MLVDLDYFYAQCEEVRNPALKGKPVVVCMYSGRSEDSGAVTTANYVARNYGVKSGMPIFLAKKKLEDVEAVFLPVDFELYEQVSTKVMDLLRNFADEFEQVGIDEAYLDVTGRSSEDFGKAEELAREIKKDLWLKQKLTCSVGIGPNKLVAKIAADENKPDGLTVVRSEGVPSFLDPLPVDRLIGVGKKTLEKMQEMGISNIGELATYDVQELIAVFGRTLGGYFHNASIGIDNEPVKERGEAESISRIATLKVDTRDLVIIMEKTAELSSDLHQRILMENSTFQTVSIIAVTTDLGTHTRSRTLEKPSSDAALIDRTVRELFERYLSESDVEIRRVGVKLSNFSGIGKSQKQITSYFQTT